LGELLKEPVPKENETPPEEFVKEIHKPSKGEELLKRIEENIKSKDVSTNDLAEKVSPDAPSDPVDISRDGVEVVDVKIVPKEENEEFYIDKFGIPHKGPRKTWDKI